MRKIIIIFSVFFLLFLIIGYIKGRNFSKDPEVLYKTIINQITIHHVEQVTKRPQFILLYEVNNEVLYSYDLRKDNLVPQAKAMELELSYKEGALRRSFDKSYFDETIFLQFIGIPAAGITLAEFKDFLKWKNLSKSEASKRFVYSILTAVAGAISGYTWGYKIGTINNSMPDSPEIIEILSHKENWIKITKLYIQTLSLNLMRVAFNLKDKHPNESLKILGYVRLININNKNPHINDRTIFNANLSILQLAYHIVKQVYQEDFNQSEKLSSKNPFFLEWWFIIITSLTLISFTLIILFLVKKSKSGLGRKASKRRK